MRPCSVQCLSVIIIFSIVYSRILQCDVMIPETVRNNPWVRATFSLVVVVTALWFLISIWNIVFLFGLAFFLAYVLDPAVDRMQVTLGIGRVLAVTILLTVIVLLLTGLGYYLTQQVLLATQEIGTIIKDPPDIQAWIQSVAPEFLYESLRTSIEQFEVHELYQRFLEYLRTQLSNIMETLNRGSNFLAGFARQTLGIVGIVVNGMVLIFATIYFLKDFDTLILNLRKLIPMRYRPATNELFREIDEMLRAFFRGYLIVSLTIGVLYGTGYLLIGLKGGFLVGFLTGMMNFIPYIGPTLGFLLAFGLGVYQFGLSWSLLGIVVVFVLVQSLEGNVLTPNIVGGAVGLNPVTVIFALLVFAQFFGIIGLLLAIPLTGIIKVFLRRLFRYYQNTEFYRKPPNG